MIFAICISQSYLNKYYFQKNKHLDIYYSMCTFENLSPFLSFLHLSQLYMLSPFNSSSEKKNAKQSWSVTSGP